MSVEYEIMDDLVKYIKRLEELLIIYSPLDREDIKDIRKDFIKPALSIKEFDK